MTSLKKIIQEKIFQEYYHFINYLEMNFSLENFLQGEFWNFFNFFYPFFSSNLFKI